MHTENTSAYPRLKVSNFGPIKQLDLEIKDYSIFIGAQATGKSTLAKLIYFFLTAREEMMQAAINVLSSPRPVSQDPTLSHLNIQLGKKLENLFEKTTQPFFVSFQYREGYTIALTLKDEHTPHITYSDSFINLLKEISEETAALRARTNPPNSNFHIQAQQWYTQIQGKLNVLGDEDRTIVYVPAGRSLLSSFVSSYELGKNQPSFDYAIRHFTDRIFQLKNLFAKSLDEIIINEQEHSAQLSLPFDGENLLLAKELMGKILKGEYRYNESEQEDMFYFSDAKPIKFSFASSGQQEAVWILQLIFSLMLNNKSATLLIEEPEAHLFPDAQDYMVQLISLFANQNGNRVILNTHSPYILSSVNNLIYAAQVGKQHPEEVDKIIPAAYWIDYNKVGAYRMEKGTINSILNDEFERITEERIDEVSSVLGEQFKEILHYDDSI